MDSVDSIYNAKIEQIQSRVNNKLAKFGVEQVDFAEVLGLTQQQQVQTIGTDYSLRPYYGTELVYYEDENTYNDLIEQKAEEYDVDPDLIKAIMRKESNFKQKAHSYADAKGLMQLMPGTANDMGVTDRFDPEQSVDGGTKYIKMMLDWFGDERLALAAYFSGPNRVKSYNITDPDNEAQYNRLPEATQTYVEKVMSYRDVYARI